MLRDSVLLVPELLDLINRSPLALNESLQTLESQLKQSRPDPLKGMRTSILAGFCLVAGAILVSFGSPWPFWVILFLFAFVFAIK